jgi:hypothetical protein
MINSKTILNLSDAKVKATGDFDWLTSGGTQRFDKYMSDFAKLIPKNGVRVRGQGYSYFLAPTAEGWNATSSDGADFKIKFFTDIHEWAFDKLGLEHFVWAIFDSIDNGRLNNEVFAATQIDQEQHELEQMGGKITKTIDNVLKEAHWIKTASENNLTANQKEKVDIELNQSTISFQELAHLMSPIVKASVEDIYQYLLNEKSFWQYRHRIAAVKPKVGDKIKVQHGIDFVTGTIEKIDDSMATISFKKGKNLTILTSRIKDSSSPFGARFVYHTFNEIKAAATTAEMKKQLNILLKKMENAHSAFEVDKLEKRINQIEEKLDKAEPARLPSWGF